MLSLESTAPFKVYVLEGWKEPLEREALMLLKNKKSTADELRYAQGILYALDRFAAMFAVADRDVKQEVSNRRKEMTQ